MINATDFNVMSHWTQFGEEGEGSIGLRRILEKTLYIWLKCEGEKRWKFLLLNLNHKSQQNFEFFSTTPKITHKSTEGQNPERD